MKVLLYFENEEMIKKSGIGRALRHQKQALEIQGFEYTTNRNDTFDIAHVNTYNKKSYKLVKFCKKYNIPVVVHGHSTKEDFRHSFKGWQFLQFFINRKLRKIYSIPDIIVTPTNYSKKLIEGYNFVTCPVKAISNGIDLKQYKIENMTEDEIIKLKAEYNIKPEEKVVVGIGWYFERKGIHDFIETAKSMPNIKFIWFGQRLRALIPKKINKAVKNKPDNVILPGYVDSSVIAKFLHISSCFFFPSYEETEGIVLLEAMAAKAPVLVRDIGAFDYLTDGIDCYKATTNEGFKEAILKLINMDTTDMTNKAYDIVKERDIHVVSEQLKEIYLGLLNNKTNKA